jgi:hypothetical protein
MDSSMCLLFSNASIGWCQLAKWCADQFSPYIFVSCLYVINRWTPSISLGNEMNWMVLPTLCLVDWCFLVWWVCWQVVTRLCWFLMIFEKCSSQSSGHKVFGQIFFTLWCFPSSPVVSLFSSLMRWVLVSKSGSMLVVGSSDVYSR